MNRDRSNITLGYAQHTDAFSAGRLAAMQALEQLMSGFYSGVEIAPFLGRARPLDWTGVLALSTMAH